MSTMIFRCICWYKVGQRHLLQSYWILPYWDHPIFWSALHFIKSANMNDTSIPLQFLSTRPLLRDANLWWSADLRKLLYVFSPSLTDANGIMELKKASAIQNLWQVPGFSNRHFLLGKANRFIIIINMCVVNHSSLKSNSLTGRLVYVMSMCYITGIDPNDVTCCFMMSLFTIIIRIDFAIIPYVHTCQWDNVVKVALHWKEGDKGIMLYAVTKGKTDLSEKTA